MLIVVTCSLPSGAVCSVSELLNLPLHLQKCWVKEYQGWEICTPESRKMYKTKFLYNIDVLRDRHQALYLGLGKKVETFKDQRLVNYW